MSDPLGVGVPELRDGLGRRVRDLRVSVTDRCNFRCTYCMPQEGMQWLPREDVLTFEEIERLVRVCVERFGFESVRITGGEPTVRAQLPVLVRKLARIRLRGEPIDVSMTTNGASLARLAHDLRAAGLRRVNISCDSLRPARFAALTRRDALASVLEGIDVAIAAGFSPVKVNVVVVRGVNDDEAVEFAAFGREKGVQVRFIEFMPLDADQGWELGRVVPASEIVDAISSVYPLEALVHGPEPATRFRYADGRGEIGVIASVTRPFCGNCDRVRITSDGRLRNCLFALEETDLRSILRGGGTDEDLVAALRANVATKWPGHRIGKVDFVRPARSMSQIGG